jgi:hypothetical protein
MMFAAPACADAPPGGTSAQTLPQWWGGAGRPGYAPDAEYAGGMQWTLAGLVAGSWTLRDPITAASVPAPGVVEAQVPMAWYDSAAVIVGEDGAWSGYGAGIATAQGFVRAPSGSRPRAMLAIVNGSDALDRNSIFITRGQESGWLRGGATGDQRGGMGDLGLAGDHLWTVAAGTKRGANWLDAGFTQRGMGESQRTGTEDDQFSGVSEGARGQSQHAGWSRAFGRDSLALNLASGFDSRAVVPLDGISSTVWRDAHENDADLQWWRRSGERSYALRVNVRDSRVVRAVAAPIQRWSMRSTWLSARTTQPLAGGALDLQFGVGSDRTPAGPTFAPGASWRTGRAGRSLRLFAERALAPVWSELEYGVEPFTQDTWLGGLDAAAGRPDVASAASLTLLAGQTGSRATQLRYPIRAESFVIGWRRDTETYRFALVQGTASTHWRALAWDATGYALARPIVTSQPRVDPGLGARTGIETRFKVFAGDLGIRLRVEGAYVGARETDARQVYYAGGPPVPEVMLHAFGTLAVAATFTLGDATIALRAEGLGTGRHPESWVDPSQSPGFIFARDAGPQMRVEATWPLFN